MNSEQSNKNENKKEFDVCAQVKIYVDEPINLPQVKKDAESLGKIQNIWEEDIGFGIKIVKINYMLSDVDGGTDKLEAAVRNISHVSEVEIESVSRV